MITEHERYMRMCLGLAGKGRTSPNPMVGCVIVKDGRIISAGYHIRAGMWHAEINALRKAGIKAKGATLYVNLEPCCHHGRTPPCTDAIIKAGIKKVVCAMKDPNPLVAGNGIRQLRESGITVVVGILEREARRLNEFFLKYIQNKVPFVMMKSAISLDGKVAVPSGNSRWISNDESRRIVHLMRSRFDAVLVGIGTVLEDNPKLTSRIASGHDPVRVIVDSRLRIPLTSNVLNDEKVIIATTRQYDKEKKRHLDARGVGVLVVNDGPHVDLYRLMQMLGELRIISVMIEGGSKINASVLASGIVDKVMFFIAPKILGGPKSVVDSKGVLAVDDAFCLRDITVRRISDDIMYEGYVVKNS